MCLYIKENTKKDEYGNVVPTVAKKDIACYKVLEKCNTGYTTPFLRFDVKIGQRMKAELGIRWDQVHEGIHAYTNKEKTIKRLDPGEVVVECFIPKGAKYLRGVEKDIVATEMKLKKIIWRY